MNRDITPKLMQKYFEAGRLENLSQKIPGCGTISTDLTKLFKHASGAEFFDYQISPENIEAIVVYGSALFRHFPPKKNVITKKKYLFFGPEVEEEVTEPRRMPNDLDVLLITKKNLTDDKVIVPKKTRKGDYNSDKIITPKKHVEGNSYDGCMEVIDETSVRTEEPVFDSYGYAGSCEGGINLHITYRSVDQFLNGLGKGDFVSESVMKYGLPIIGQKRFDQIVKNVKSSERKPLHSVEWSESSSGKLQGKIV